jgi:uncharacterized membrane protein YjgN (DUF898 family)
MNQSTRNPDAPALTSTSGYLDMLPVALVNAVLVILTFNVYLFWAKSRVREYLWHNTLINGRSLAYSGQGAELARGFVLTAAIFLVVFGYPGLVVINGLNIDPEALTLPDTGLIMSLVLAAVVPAVISAAALVLLVAPEFEVTPVSVGISAGALWLGMVFFMTLSRHLTYRYLLRHTHWPSDKESAAETDPGPGGEVPGSPGAYAWRMLLPELSTGVTLGWSAPWRFVRRFELLLDGATFAGRPVTFRGRSNQIYPAFAVAWLIIAGLVVAMNLVSTGLDPESPIFPLQVTAIGLGFYVGLVFALTIYNAALFRHVATFITVGGARLSFQARGRDLALLYFTNLAMNALSVGLSYYYSRMRIARFIVRHLKVEGEIEAVPSDSTPTSRRGKDVLGEGAEILLAGSYF